MRKELEIALIVEFVTGRLSDLVSPIPNPKALVERLTANFIKNASIFEVWSDDIRDDFFETLEKNGQLPIDVYLGVYLPKSQKIVIYKKAIDHFARKIECDPKSILLIVRIHEYAHSVIHLGDSMILPVEDKESFIQIRNNIFGNISEETHEALAQIITYNVLAQNNMATHLSIFSKILKFQPDIYQLNNSVFENKIIDDSSLWCYILDRIRSLQKEIFRISPPQAKLPVASTKFIK